MAGRYPSKVTVCISTLNGYGAPAYRGVNDQKVVGPPTLISLAPEPAPFTTALCRSFFHYCSEWYFYSFL